MPKPRSKLWYLPFALALFAGVVAKADPATYLALDRAYMGDGIDGTYAEIKALAETGDPIGLFRLAYLTYAGWGVERDPAAAVPLYVKALAGGFNLAAFNLAILHLEELGLPRDEEKGRAYMTVAARNGIQEAEISLYAGKILGRIPAHLAQIDQWVQTGQVSDGPSIDWLRCRFLHEGRQDAEAAQPYCRSAAEAGIPEAAMRYGLMQTARFTCKTPTCQFYDGFNRRIVLAPPLEEAAKSGVRTLMSVKNISPLEGCRVAGVGDEQLKGVYAKAIHAELTAKHPALRSLAMARLLAIKPLVGPSPMAFEDPEADLVAFANQGDPLAQVSVASLYLHGWGVERDAVKAAAWMAVAEDSQPDAWYGDYGDLVLEDLAMLRRNIGLSLTADQRLAADQQAALLRRQVADQLAKVFSDPTTSN